MSQQQSKWAVDWAGPHGTILGTINGLAGTVTVAWLTRVLGPRWFHADAAVQRNTLAVTTLASVILMLLAAALRKKQTSPATVCYQLVCMVGSGSWATYMVAHDHWGWSWFGARLVVLVVGALLAGIIATLASDPTPTPAQVEQARIQAEQEAAGRARDKLADQWIDRIMRVCHLEVDVPAIETWSTRTADGKPTGYTVEATLPPGGSTWRTLVQYQQQLAGDLNLMAGCKVEVAGGELRRTALLKVSTVNMLAIDQDYPTEHSELSINDGLPFGVQADGAVVAPVIRQNSVGIYGQKGSGKTNALHAVAAGIVRAVDALLWDVEMAGGGLSRQWAKTFLSGETGQPGVDWIALNDVEAEFMLRAARRIAYIRKSEYMDLMAEHDDDKIPCSPELPAIMIRQDEIAKVMGHSSEYPRLRDHAKFIVFEARASAVNMIFGGLEATSAIIDVDTHRQLGTVAVMRSGDEAAYAWALGTWSNGIKTEDIAWPGCAAISVDTGDPAIGMKWYRVKPSAIYDICRNTDGRHPALDEPSRLAADGRNPDGTPMEDLLDGELDCYSTRWDRYRKQQRVPAPTRTTTGNGATMNSTGSTQNGPSIGEALAGLAEADANLKAAVRKARIEQGLDPETGEPASDAAPGPEWDAECDAELEALLKAAAPATNGQQRQDPRETLRGLVPAEGITLDDLVAKLRGQNVRRARSTVHQWLKEDSKVEWRPDREGGSRGRWYPAS